MKDMLFATAEGAEESMSMADLLNQGGLTTENMVEASQTAAPIVNMLGLATGWIMALLSAGYTLITAADLAYIGIPPVRGMLANVVSEDAKMALAEAGGQAGGQQGGQQGGMQGGMGGMNRGGMGGMQGGMGGMGGMQGGMGGPQGQQGQQGQQKPPTPYAVYLKRRSVGLVLLGVCMIVLTSSFLTGAGLNLGQWFMDTFSSMM